MSTTAPVRLAGRTLKERLTVSYVPTEVPRHSVGGRSAWQLAEELAQLGLVIEPFGPGAVLVREIQGSDTNVIGLPLVEVLEALRAVGAPSAKFAAGTPA